MSVRKIFEDARTGVCVEELYCIRFEIKMKNYMRRLSKEIKLSYFMSLHSIKLK
jgi:hypothetical protein